MQGGPAPRRPAAPADGGAVPGGAAPVAVPVLVRAACRVVLVGSDDCVLLMQGRDPADPAAPPYWITLGGGALPGETPEATAVREVAEETGLRLDAGSLSGPLYAEEVEFGLDGLRYRQQNVFFAARAPAFRPDTRGWDDLERRSMVALRWWSVAELEVTEEVYYPMSLPDLVRRALAGRD